VVEHERDDEGSVYPRLAKILMDGHGLSAMSRAHREILHLARLLARVVEDLPSEMIDRYLVRDAQRVIEAIEALVRIHTAKKISTTPSWHSRRCRRRRRAGQCRQAAQSDVCRVKGAARERLEVYRKCSMNGRLRSLLSAESDRPWRYTGPPPFLSEPRRASR